MHSVRRAWRAAPGIWMIGGGSMGGWDGWGIGGFGDNGGCGGRRFCKYLDVALCLPQSYRCGATARQASMRF